jgi:ELWxxDGT repeat protein
VSYFVANDGMHGHELWHTGGTSEETRLVSDLCPGPCSSWPATLTVFGDRIAFDVTDGLHGLENWISDGAREEPRMPRDLCPGSCSALGG